MGTPRAFSSWLAALVTWGCAQDVTIQTVGRPDIPPLPPKGYNCELAVRPKEYRFSPECREIGDVYVGDTGFSVNCGLDHVLELIRGKACLAGADAAQIVAHYPPSFWGSTCDQVRARFLVCGDAGAAASEVSADE